jgi:membrane-bound serine protease (ClpP class)
MSLRSLRLAIWAALILGGLLWSAVAVSAKQDEGPRALVLQARGVVNPVMSIYIQRGLAEARDQNYEAVVIELDTPGGLDTSMREIIQAMLDSDVPVVVYVYPPGGRAASAGLFITMASHVAAMSPNTNIGSAHPVGIGSSSGGDQAAPDPNMTAKVENDAAAYIRSLAERRGRNAAWAERGVRESVNVHEREALELHIVEYVANDLTSLLAQIDGREVQLARQTRQLHTAGATTVEFLMNPLESLMHSLADPNIALILITLGTYGLIYELASPGAIFPGIVGVIALVLAFFALGMLPISYAGLALLVFGFALLIAEVLVAPGVGILAFGGMASLVVGSLLLVDASVSSVTVSPVLTAAIAGSSALFFLVLIRGVRRAYVRRPATGQTALVGQIATARTDLAPDGVVYVDGELWRARITEGTVKAGDRVRAERVDGLTLIVRPL